MKIQILSDLHTEFWGHVDISWLVPDEDVDVLVLAGDIGVAQNFQWILRDFKNRYKHVMFVPGNHEYYHSSLSKIKASTCNSFVPQWPDGQQFLGATLWFPYTTEDEKHKHLLNDFNLIKDLEWEINAQHRMHLQHLEMHMDSNSVVITHHCPSHKSTPERYKDSELNRFFVCDMEELILERQPKLWIHGHTHDSCDYMIGQTRVICNPFGYLGHEENPKFQKHLIVEV